tara:strand:+ start:5107 stop:5397 length:291 start_codon:yes stop_codon:yes gene_type:complete
MTIEQIDNHRAKACWKCGSVNFALLKSRLVECNQCGEPAGSWTDAQPTKELKRNAYEHRIRLKEKAFNEELIREYVESNLQSPFLNPIGDNSSERD